MLTLDQLRVLDAIVRAGTFTAAARELHRATSALSYAVKNLEEALGVMVFDRSAHSATLTAEGQLVLEEARAVLERTARLEQLGLQLQGGWEPQVEAVLDGVLPLPPVMRAVRRFEELGAPTRILVRTEYLSGVVERFRAGHADLMASLGVPDETHDATPLPDVEVVLVAAAGHPLTEGRQSRDELTRHVELRVADSAREAGISVANPVAALSPSTFLLGDFHAKRVALLEGVGFGWLPRHLADAPLDEGTLAIVPFEQGFRLRFSAYLASRRDAPLGRAARAFVDALTAELGAATTRGRLR